jgi:hypothetical protein
MPSCLATCFDGYEAMALPSRQTVPACGFNTRDRARSRVDLPHAFGPTITVKDPSVIRTSRFSATVLRS